MITTGKDLRDFPNSRNEFNDFSIQNDQIETYVATPVV